MEFDQIVSLSFEVTAHGWAKLSLRVGDQDYVLSGISDTMDAIGELLRAALQIATGGLGASARFDREPFEWRLLMTHIWEGVPQRRVFRLMVLEFDNFYAEVPNEFGVEAFRIECDPEGFVRAVAEAASQLLGTSDAIGQPIGWDLPFPTRAYAALQAALTQPARWDIA